MLTSSCDIFALTGDEYIQALIACTGGKGAQQAKDLYKAVLQQGRLCTKESARLPSFANAEALWQTMTETLNVQKNRLALKHIHENGDARKLIFSTEDRYDIESVIIPMRASLTLCISSQIGCRMGCRFCETGRMGLIRNLSTSEITQQLFFALHTLKAPIKNIVFMGMGEPFDNYDAVIQASRVFMDMNGFGFGPKNITISTSGKVDEINRFTKETLAQKLPNLAISLNGATNELRSSLMPHNRKEPLEAIFQAAGNYIEQTGRDILFGYVLIDTVNDSAEHAAELASFLMPLRDHARVNLIPYNPQSIDRFQPPSDEKIDTFIQSLRQRGLRVFIRRTKGRPIMAGCGQLGNAALRKSRRTEIE